MTLCSKPLALTCLLLSATILPACASAPPSPSPVTAAPPSPPVSRPSPANMTIESNGLGPLRLGMSRAELLAAPDVTLVPSSMSLEGQPTPTLRVMREGHLLAIVELVDDRAYRIRVESPELATRRGARVGMTASELSALDGEGRALTGEGNVCALFEEEPGLSFCFRPEDPNVNSWERLLRSDARVSEILVVGITDTPGVDE